MKNIYFSLLVLFYSSLYAEETLLDSSMEDLLNTSVETKAQVGTRDNSKENLESTVPIDVITLNQIKSSGTTKVTELLSYYIAGFNAVTPSLTDGADHIVSYSLRGMQPDQILVLVNGKRYHSNALIFTTSIFSRGSSFVDLNSIPLISIERVEVLRDGAAAQYGSDAISGVINIILKSNSDSSISVHSGIRKEGDGEFAQVDSFINIPLDYDGFFNISLSATKQNPTNRARLDKRSGITPPRITTHLGLPEHQNLALVLNSEVISDMGTVFYSNAIINYKDSKASTFYRTPNPSRAIYPEGFLPMLTDKMLDYSITLGARGKFENDIYWDLSNVYGYSSSSFSLDNSMNYDLNSSSPTSFNNGKIISIQNTTNLDIKRYFDNFYIAGGLEYRYENYTIQAGDYASYTQTGSQGFPGFQPMNADDKSRESGAIYLDSNYDFSKKFSIQLALRHEYYSDFGTTNNYKVATKYKIIPNILWRASASSGFRAPSLAQSTYSYASSSLINGIFYLKGVFQPSHPVSKSLGAKELKAEDSTHYTTGVVITPTKHSSLMIDYFYTRIRNKILLSDIKTPSTALQTTIFNQYGVSKTQYFRNIADIETQGIDIKYNNIYTFSNDSKLSTTLWYSYSETKVINSDNLTLSTLKLIEELQPKSKVKFLNIYKVGSFKSALNINYYDSFIDNSNGIDNLFNSAITVDLDLNYRYSDSLDISIGGLNIFDAMPDKWTKSNDYVGYDGIVPYNNNSPIGFSGAYYYLKLNYKF